MQTFDFDSGIDSRLVLKWREIVKQLWNAMETFKQERKWQQSMQPKEHYGT